MSDPSNHSEGDAVKFELERISLADHPDAPSVEW